MVIPQLPQSQYEGKNPLDDQGQKQSQPNYVDISLCPEQVSLVCLPSETIHIPVLVVLPHGLVLPHLPHGACEKDRENAEENPKVPGEAEESVQPVVKTTEGCKNPAPHLSGDQREQQQSKKDCLNTEKTVHSSP
eukprot:GFUD01077014.1.p2 GENE.GFUD01077014.1~~GFUD01077014.1.p2  ORF type:complete len:135 (+),score=34.14 GFUD01077014.1:494-898(+)